MLRGVGPLLGAAHLEPSLAVTLAACALAIGAGLGTRTLIVVLAIGSGQLSIGWSNDWLDWHRDQASGRHDKPVAQHRVSPRAVAVASVAAAAVCVVASLALSVAAGLVHLVGVAAGWFYNVRAKHTWYSVAPWALAFGLLPAVVTLTAPLGRWPAWWVLVAGAALGSGAHFANAIPDLEHDRATGVTGLPHRLGRRRSLFAALAMVAVGVVVVAVSTASAVLGGLAALLLAAVAVAAVRGRDRLAFRGVVVLLLLLAIGLVTAGAGLYS
jgi:4-hydroxybenzoate polyprenyltransferase